MTAAQKKARATFMRAIEYRKKHPGVTLKQAFAWAKKSSVGSTAAVGAKKTKSVAKKRKPVARKKAASKSYHKDTKSHNVNIRVVSGIANKMNWPKDYAKRVNDVGNVTTALKVWMINLAQDQAELYMAKTQAEKREYRKRIAIAKKILTQLKKLQKK